MDKYVVLSKNGKLFLHYYVSCYFYMLMLSAICLSLQRCEQSYFTIKCLIGTPIHTFIQYTMTKLNSGAWIEIEISPSKLSVITKTNSVSCTDLIRWNKHLTHLMNHLHAINLKTATFGPHGLYACFFNDNRKPAIRQL